MTAMRPAWRSTLLAALCVFATACSSGIDHAALRAEVGSTPVVLLSTAWCGYCRKLRADLERWGVAFDEIDVETTSEGQRAYDLVDGRGVPILLIGEHVVHGYAPAQAREQLAAAGIESARVE